MKKHIFAKWAFVYSMKIQCFLIVFLYCSIVCGSTIEVSSWDELNQSISGGSQYANLPNTDTTIKFLGDITHFNTDSTVNLVPLCVDSPNNSFNLLNQCQITINGNGYTLSTNFDVPLPGFFVGGNPFTDPEAASSVRIEDLTISSVSAHGGNSRRGGGGAAFGGGLFVNTNTSVTLSNVNFSNCSAVGGSSASGPTSIVGGGGMGGAASSAGGGFNQGGISATGGGCTFLTGSAAAGGVGGSSTGKGGGDVGGINGSNGGDAASGGGGGGSTTNGGNGGGMHDPGQGGLLTGAGGNAGIGGGAGGATSASAAGGGGGGYVGGGGSSLSSLGGGGGGFGGGGGAGSNLGGGGGGGFGGGGGAGGNFYGGGGGGFGGGGGGNPIGGSAGGGGNGGFGGGGGGGAISGEGVGGFGGGNGIVSISGGSGGGALGAGGAIFVHTGSTLNIESATFNSNSVTGGTGANAGQAYGKDIFLVSGGNIHFNLTEDTSCYAIGGNYSQGGFVATGTSGVTIDNDPGITLALSSTGIISYNGLFDGILQINGGICSIDSDYCLGYSTVNPSINGGTLATTQSVSTARTFSIGSSGATLQPTTSTTLAFTGIVVGSANATLNLSGAGTTTFSTLEVDSGTFTLSGPFGGSGSLTKTGNGTLFLPANAPSFTGNLIVNAGALKVNGVLNSSSEINLAANTVLNGTGTVGEIFCSGTIAPGNSVGVLNSGSITFNPGSIFQVEIDSTGASLLNVDGTANLAGSVDVVANAGSFSSTGKPLILAASTSISGAFSPDVTGASIGGTSSRFSLIQEGNNLYLSYQLLLPTAALSGNQLAIANYLNSNPNNLSSYFIGTTASELEQALNSVSPARNAFGTYITEQTALSLSDIVATHMDNYRFDKRASEEGSFLAALTADASSDVRVPKKKTSYPWTSWISGFGEISRVEASQQNPAFNYLTGALLLGFDYSGQNGNLVGGGFGYAHSHFYDAQDAGHGNINCYFASIYGSSFKGNFYFSPAIWGLFNQIDNTRKISFPGFSQKATADILAWQLVPHLELGYLFTNSHCKVTPFTSLDWPISWQKAYTEHGASGFAISQKANTNSLLRSETGLKICETWDYSWGTFLLREKAAYIFEKPFHTGTVIAAFVGVPGDFTVVAVQQNLNLGAVGIGTHFLLGKDRTLAIDFEYEGEFGSRYWSNDLMLTVKKSF